MNLWQIAWRNLLRRKLRTFLILMSIVIGVGSTFAVIASVDTAKKALPLYLKAAFGKADYEVNGTSTYFSDQVFQEIQQLDNTDSVAVLKQNTKVILDKTGVTSIQKRVEISGYSKLNTSVTNFKLLKGNLTSGGAIITDQTASVWNIHVGDSISFDTDLGIKTIPVSAIVKYTVELMGPSSWSMAYYHPWAVAVPLSDVQEWFGLQGKIQNIQVKSIHGADTNALGKRLDAVVKHFDNLYVQPVVIDTQSYSEADSFFLALYIAGFLGIVLSAFIIFNSLYVSIKERKNEFAALKTIGYSPGQLRTFVFLEVILLSMIGTLVGLLFGYGLGAGLKALIYMILEVNDDGSLLLVKGVTVSTLAGLLIPVAAALYPIQQVGKVSVIEVLKENRATTNLMKKWQWIIGILFILSGFFIKSLLLVLPVMIGVTLVYPFLFNMIRVLLKPVFKRFFGFSGNLAAANLSRNLGRSSMTSGILCMGIAMIVLMSSLNSALMQTYENMIYSTYGGDLDIQFHHTEKTDLERLKKIQGIADAKTYAYQAVIWKLHDEKRKLPVYGVGEDWIDHFPLFKATGNADSELIKKLQPNELILDKIAYEVWGGKIGESIRLTTLNGDQNFKVVAIVDTMKNSGYGAFMKDAQFREDFGLKYEKNALIIKDQNITPLQLRQNIYNEFGSRVEKMFGPEDWVSIIRANYTGSFSIIDGLVILSIFVSGIGITNTLLINIMERIRELGMMRAVGVTRRQVMNLVLLEGFGIGLAAAVIGSVLGILLIYRTSMFFEIHALTYQFGVSWNIILYTGLFGIFVSLMSSFMPASRAAKTRLSEALRYE